MLYYYKSRYGNFGDDLNPWLWPKLAPEVCGQERYVLFLGIGTLLDRQVPEEPAKIVFGSGCSDGQAPAIDSRWTIHCVRGPLTAAKLKISPSLALTDPAILIRRYAGPEEKKLHAFSFMPHHQSLFYADWNALCAKAGIHCIDPRWDVERVISEIKQTKLLLSEAMHGAIVADALRTPWIPIRINRQFSEFKWRDWTQSLQVDLSIHDVPPIFTRTPFSRNTIPRLLKNISARLGMAKPRWRLPLLPTSPRQIDATLSSIANIAKRSAPYLSSDRIVHQMEDSLLERVSQLRAGWKIPA